jgi:ABC-2 type transport system permease protein
MTAVLVVGAFLSALLMGGGSEMLLPMVTAKDGAVVLSSPIVELLKQYALSGVKVVVMTTLAFALSSLMRSAAVATGVSLFAFLSGSLLVTMLREFGLDWSRYLLFANMDFNAVILGTTGFSNHSLGTAVVVVLLHMVVFLLTAWDGFVRREV